MNFAEIDKLPVELVRIDDLAVHEDNASVFDAGTPEENDQLAASIRDHGVVRALLVLLVAAETPRYVVLAGHRRLAAAREAGLVEVPVRVLRALDEEARWMPLVADNGIHSTQRGPRGEKAQWRVESYARTNLQRGRGRRSDLAGEQGAETDDLIAALVGQSRTSIRDRHKIFGSAVASHRLRELVDSNQIKRSVAADLVRQVEREVREGVLAEEEAHARCDALLDEGARPRRPKQSRREQDEVGGSSLVGDHVTGCDAAMSESVRRAEELGRRWGVTIESYASVSRAPVGDDVDHAGLIAAAATDIARAAVALARVKAIVEAKTPFAAGGEC